MRYLAQLLAAIGLAACTFNHTEPVEPVAFDYMIHSPEEVLEAYANVFRLADGEDVTFITPAAAGPRHTLVINHTWSHIFIIFNQWGTDTYTLKAVPIPPVGTKLHITAQRRANTMLATTLVDLSSPGLFALLHERALYFLGDTEDWRTCAEQRAMALPGSLEMVCAWTADDLEPPL